MKRIVEIVPATPGWYARWRLAQQHTMSYPVMVWALVEDSDGSQRQVAGVDSMGQWPGGGAEQTGDFVMYVYQEPGRGEPDDVFNPAKTPIEE